MLALIFDNLSRHAGRWVKEWNAGSAERRRLRYPTSERVLQWAGEHSVACIVLVWLATTTLSVVLGWAVPSYFGFSLFPAKGKESELLTYFGTLWTIQATIAALVYPIVIAFVAVLLQRRATAKLSLRLYLLDTAVAPAGGSAIALLTWMGLQYLSVSFVSITCLAVAMIGNSAWFVLNSLLTGRFLHRTVRFLNDEARLEVFKRFAVQNALVREVKGHLSRLVFSNAQAHKLIPGAEYTSNEPGPKVVLFPMSDGTPHVVAQLENEREVSDIRLRLLRWGIRLWLRQAKRISVPPAIAGLEPEYPVLEIPIVPGHVVEGRVALARVLDGPPPGGVAAFFIRHSVVFGAPPTGDVSCSTAEILEELSAEVLELAERNRFEAATEAVRGLVELHAALIKCGAFVNEAGKHDNAALLRDPYGLGSRAIHERWLEPYRPLGEMAVRNLTFDSTIFRRHCYLSYHVVDSLRGQHLDILTYTIHISTHLMYRLGIWWSEKIEERGLIEHNASDGVMLPPPLSGTYDQALRSFIGGWEQITLSEPLEEFPNADEAWAAHCRQARFAAAQAEETVHMLLSAVFRGDRTGALWLADSFLRWLSKLEHRFEGHDPDETGNRLLTFACVRKEWAEIRETLDAIPHGAQESAITSEVAATVLRRYWTDLRLIVVCILLDWTPANSPDAFALELANALLQGRNLKHGGDIDADALTNSSLVLIHLIRLRLADREYTEILDKVVERAQDLRKPEMVSGRVYSSVGADDVESLCLAQAQILTAITAAPIVLSDELCLLVRTWSEDLPQLQRLKRLAEQLVDCMGSEAFHEKHCIIGAIRRELGLPDNAEELQGWVHGTLEDIGCMAGKAHEKTLEQAAVTQTRLDELGKAVSDYVLATGNKVFPFTIQRKIEEVSVVGERRSSTFRGLSKAPYTDPPLGTETSSTRDMFCRYVALDIGIWVVTDHLKAVGESPLRKDSEQAFFEDMASKADALRARDCSPLLLVPAQGAPAWLRPWRQEAQGADTNDAVSFRRRKSTDPETVIGYFNEVPAHRVSLDGKDCYVVGREAFETMIYEARKDGSCVSVSYEPLENQKLSLTFEWAFGLATTQHSAPGGEGSKR